MWGRGRGAGLIPCQGMRIPHATWQKKKKKKKERKKSFLIPLVASNSTARGSPRRNPGMFAENQAHWMFHIESDRHKQMTKLIPQEVSKSQVLSFWTQNNPRNLASPPPAFPPPSSASTANTNFSQGCEVCSREQIQSDRCEM